MELISASRVVRAQQRANAARPYAAQITKVIEDLAAGGANIDHPLLREVPEVRKCAYIVLSSDRGLAGAYNSSVIRAAHRELEAGQLEGQDYELVTVGRKALGYFRFRGYRISHSVEGISDKPTYEDARAIADKVTEMFTAGEVDRVILAYTEFKSIASQKVVVRRFLPLEQTETIAEQGSTELTSAYEFEPSPEDVLADLLPRYIEARLYAALLDAAASEHASRQRAMKSATDNADDIITKLTRSLNRARQDSITTEIMEIISGAEGLKEDEDAEGELVPHHVMGLHLFPQDLDPLDPARRHHQGHGDTPPAASLPRVDVASSASGQAAPQPLVGSTAASAGSGVGALDDLTRIEGIGPRIGEALNAAGITTFAALAAAGEGSLRSALEAAKLRFAPSLPTWAAQAAYLVSGDEAGFKAYTDRLVAGREPDKN